MELGAYRDRWMTLCDYFKGESDIWESEFKKLAEHYQEEGRYYHNLEHLRQLFRQLSPLDIQNPPLIEFAIWFHDVIYDPKSSENEKLSAEYAKQSLKKIAPAVDSGFVDELYDIIIRTQKHHTGDASLDAQHFLDADLSVLGSAEEDYLQYAEKIRKEYSHVPQEIYRVERAKVLKRFLERPEIYSTEHFRNLYEDQARENLKTEIALLT